MFLLENVALENALGDSRWQLEGGSLQHELYKSKIVLRCWSHIWPGKKKKKHQEEAEL
jgi:hypothetical protein